MAAGLIMAGLICAPPMRSQEPAPPAPKPKSPSTVPPQQAPPAAEPQKPIPAKIDPMKEANIRQLLEVIGTRAAMDQTVRTMTQSGEANLERSLPKNENSRKFVELFYAKLQAKLKTDDFVNLIIPIYDKYLTSEDIDGLIHFYQSPLGQRALNVLPRIIQEAQTVGYQWGQRAGQEAAQEVIAEHPELKDVAEPPADKPKP
ncbi:MAG: DUF2059 domain-containing protein [Candidatus Acidiferrales bacterium]